MKTIAAFFKLIRWPNLVFIGLTQVLFQYCILEPVLQSEGIESNIHGLHFWLIAGSYIFIAAAGYVINDYFDLNIDQINKPSKVIVAQVISRRWVILWHVFLSAAAVLASFYVDRQVHIALVGWAAVVNVVVLFFYSTTLKKKFLIGNILIAAVIAWGIVMLTVYEFNYLWLQNPAHQLLHNNKLLRLTYLYAGFAFVISIIREVVKDMEDVEGDRRFGCKTMPVVWGLNATKVFVAVWLVVLIGTLVMVQVYVVRYQWWLSIVYSSVLLIAPLLWVFKKLYAAQTAHDFHQLSTAVKLVMFAGIVSMVFFRLY